MIRHAFAATVLSTLPLLPPAAAPIKGPELTIGIGSGIATFTVESGQPLYLGAAIASLSPELVHYLVDLPPLLSDFVVLGIGIGTAEEPYVCTVPERAFPAGIMLYAQGVTIDLPTILSSPVHEFVLDVTVPTSPGGQPSSGPR
jgi:hypothetical protein